MVLIINKIEMLVSMLMYKKELTMIGEVGQEDKNANLDVCGTGTTPDNSGGRQR